MKRTHLYETPFEQRHIGPDNAETQDMLRTLNVESIDKLMEQTIPGDIRLQEELPLRDGIGEHSYLHSLEKIADKNKVFRSYIGHGYYGTRTPSVIRRNILENPGWYTSYTPYQAEISQGRLEAILNFQTMVADLTGMEIANASLLDEATAAAEAMIMAHGLMQRNARRKHSKKFFVSETCFPQTIDVLLMRAEPLGYEVVVGDHRSVTLDNSYFGALLQYPDVNGAIEDYNAFISSAQEFDLLLVFAADLMAMTQLTPPGELGADIVVGSSQRFGIPMGFGGPHAGYFATRQAFVRQIPGRIIGVSVDRHGNKAFRMTLQTREQHIRREKATSNICTAQALLAVMAGMYAVYHGPGGLRCIGDSIHRAAVAVDRGLAQLGFSQINEQYFDTLNVTGRCPCST
jgi:glycine dehydrogenase